MKKLHLLLVVACLIGAAFAPSVAEARAARDTGIGWEYPSLLRGVRPLGMGNAFVAMPGTDYVAQFYNPAAINDFEAKRHYQFLNPTIGFSSKTFSLISDVKQLNDDLKGATNQQKIDRFETFTREHTGEFHHVDVGIPLALIRHKWYAGGIVADSRSTISLRNMSFPNFEVKSISDIGGIVGSAYGFFDETLQVGGNLKFLYRMGIEDQVTTADAVNGSIGGVLGYSQWKKGFGVGVDLGAKYKIPFMKDTLAPTFAVSFQDIGMTRFTGGAQKTPMSLTAGAGIFPKIGDIELAILTDFREINQRVDILKKFHFGVEAKFPEVIHTKLAVRAGCNQGYPAVGMSAEWPIVTLNLAFYGEESGERSYQKANYRFMSQLAFGF